jgi:hypothetical protein
VKKEGRKKGREYGRKEKREWGRKDNTLKYEVAKEDPR